MSDLVPAARFLSVSEAEIAHTFLTSEGIQSFVFDNNFGNVAAGGPMTARGIRLMVRNEDFGEASRLLQQVEKPRPVIDSPKLVRAKNVLSSAAMLMLGGPTIALMLLKLWSYLSGLTR